MKIVHFCAGLEEWNGMARNARELVKEETRDGFDSHLTNNSYEISGKIDVVYIHGAWLPILWKVAKRAKAIRAKLIIMPEASYDPIRRAYHGWKKRLVSLFEHAMLRRADVVMAACEEEREWIDGYHPGLNIEITDLKRFFNLSKPIIFSHPKDAMTPIHVLYLGRKHPLKGLEYLEQAVAELNYCCKSRIPGCENINYVELKIVSGVFGAELEKIWEWTDVLCLPTLTEDFGRVVAEALERGKPVITTDGAPAWKGQKGVIYLEGYRNAVPRTRVSLLKYAIFEFLSSDQP